MFNNDLSDLCYCQYDTQFHVENNKRGGKAQALDLCNYALKKMEMAASVNHHDKSNCVWSFPPEIHLHVYEYRTSLEEA